MEIKYVLSAVVDGEVVYRGEFLDTTSLEESLYKPERAVERHLEEQE